MLVVRGIVPPEWLRALSRRVSLPAEPAMFERFTDRARRAVVLAQENARLLNHGYIGTEHLLLGLSREGEALAAKALDGNDILDSPDGVG